VNGNDTVQFKQNDTVVMRLTSEGHLLPGACNTYDLGSSNYRFKDLYLSGNTLDIGGTQIKRMEDTGALMITDDSGDAQSGYFKHVYVDGTIQGSNLKILGDFVTLDTITSNTEQMVITNAGTGPALKVTQTGANSIAEFYDDGNVLALKIADGGNVGIGTSIMIDKLCIASPGVNDYHGIRLYEASTTAFGGFLKYHNGEDRLTLGTTSSSIDINAINIQRNTGNVGIGTTNPQSTFHVNGNTKLNNVTITDATNKINFTIGTYVLEIDLAMGALKFMNGGNVLSVFGNGLTSPAIQRLATGPYIVNLNGVQRTLYYDNTTASGGWVAVKYMYNTSEPIQQSSHSASTTYYLEQQAIKDIMFYATDILFREDSSNTLAKMINSTQFNVIKDNVLNGRSWFYNTHGGNTLSGWLVGVDGKSIPDAQQSGCNSYTTTNWLMVFDSCANANGSHTNLNNAYRMRADTYTTLKAHSIWLKVG